MFFARRIGGMLCPAPLRACFGLGRCSCGARGFGRFDPALLDLHFAARSREFAFDRLQTAAFGEPPCCASRRVCRGGKTIPTPKIALARNQALAGLEYCR